MEVKIERGEVVVELTTTEGTTTEGTETITVEEVADRITGEARYNEQIDIPKLVSGLARLINTYEDSEARALLRRLVTDYTYAMDPYNGYEDQAWCATCNASWGPNDDRVHKDECLWKSLLDFLDMDDPFLP